MENTLRNPASGSMRVVPLLPDLNLYPSIHSPVFSLCCCALFVLLAHAINLQ